MDHFIRIAFWIFTVSATISNGHPTPLRVGDFHITRMEKEVECTADSKFYTPQNVKDECIKGAMECVLKELNTAKWDCDDKNNRTSAAIYSLQRHLDGNYSATSAPDKCTCESYPQTDFKEFLSKFKTLIQRQNNASTR